MEKTKKRCAICKGIALHNVDGSFDTDIFIPREYRFLDLCIDCYFKLINENLAKIKQNKRGENIWKTKIKS